MTDEIIRSSVETITTNGTLGHTIECVCAGILLICFAGMLYQLYKVLCTSLAMAEARQTTGYKKLHNEVYLDGVYTAYKAGVVHKEAEEKGIDMKFAPVEEAENGLITKLNEEVEENLNN